MEERPIRVLVIEDDDDYALIITLCLNESDDMDLRFQIDRARTLAEGLARVLASPPDAVVADLTLPDSRGIETALRIMAAAPDVPVLVSTNLGDEKAALEAMRRGAQDFMVKATTDSRLIKRAIRYAIERKAALTQRDQILRAAADGMIVVDDAGIIRFANAAAEELLGSPAAQLVGKPAPFEAKAGETKLIEIPRPDGTRASVEMRVTAVDWSGRRAALASLRDVTALRRLEQVKSEVAERRRNDRLKDEWIGMLSHDIRTPLTIVKGALADLHEDAPPGTREHSLTELGLRQAERLERMTVKLLDLARLESGRARLEAREFDPAEAVRRTVAGFLRAAADRALILETVLDGAPPAVRADPELFDQLVSNLLDNALRFARDRVVARVTGDAEIVRVEVEDDGVGIPADKKEMLFTRFVQLERRKEPGGYRGTGLGLAICRQIADLHHGRIEVDSEPGRGTRFTVTLPVGKPGAEPPRAPEPREQEARP